MEYNRPMTTARLARVAVALGEFANMRETAREAIEPRSRAGPGPRRFRLV